MLKSNVNFNVIGRGTGPKQRAGDCGEIPTPNLQQNFRCPNCDKILDEIKTVWSNDWKKEREEVICPCGYTNDLPKKIDLRYPRSVGKHINFMKKFLKK